MKNELIELISKKLSDHRGFLKTEFNRQHPIEIARHFTVDNLLPDNIAQAIYAHFPQPKKMRLLHSYGELKMKYMHIKNTSNPCGPIATACVNAGFTMGDNTDKGFWKNCMQPLLLNQTVSGVTLDAKDIKACRQFKIAKMKVELKQLQKVK